MDILKDKNLIYVINHAMEDGGERIEVLHVETNENDVPQSLIYVKSIIGEMMN